ncbi:uncharacterized protein LACBIDRAFT_327726 [Laccaria bicolor S238N-H82]|uniref:Predicted protein n=1 Tax=Laccaria bicolor (strain S238N-H82 / ATCC MYA-4686) TaxID=486041 RepID=B0DCP1_LACBS|nr:uncharacterized protein LACBIDRAFT_327726 [Laccaria bicolor S238N-H82]EDR07932.1 predicted protein [Laccaria bicolor S238N-H82]|eukprot:XP_001881721.1 predicted protein [Laccaria bicolor S238N-H82]
MDLTTSQLYPLAWVTLLGLYCSAEIAIEPKLTSFHEHFHLNIISKYQPIQAEAVPKGTLVILYYGVGIWSLLNYGCGFQSPITMIVLLTEGDERSPLKTTPPQLPSQFQAPAPPPYSPPANAHGQGLLGRPTPTFCQSLHRDIHSHDQPSGSVSQRTSRRFIHSVDIAARVDRSKINLGDYHGYSVELSWVISKTSTDGIYAVALCPFVGAGR